MPVFNNQLAGAAGSGGAGAGYKIERSLRFNDGDSAHLTRSFQAGSQTKWTWSSWIKRAELGATGRILRANPSGEAGIQFLSNDRLEVYHYENGSYVVQVVTDRVFRDPTAWFHLVVVYDSDQATAADRLVIYINGVKETQFNTSTYPSQGYKSYLNSATSHAIFGSDLFPAGYLADVHFLDGIAISDPDGVFGEFDSTTGVWNPIEYTDNYNGAAVAGTSYSSATGAKSLYNTTNDGQTLGSGYSSGAIPSTTKLIIPGFNLTEGGGTSGSGQSISNNGVTTVTSNTKYYGTALQFGTAPQQGNNASNSFSFSQNLGLSGANYFTFEAWVYPRSGHGHDFVIIFEGDWNNNNGLMFYLDSSRYPKLTLGNGSFQSFASSQQVPFDKWTHVACVNNNNTISFYVNGNKDTASGTRTKNYSLGNNHRLIGAYRDSNHTAGPRNPFYGYMTDIRVTSDARYTSSFTVPGGGAVPAGVNGFHLDFDPTAASQIFSSGTLTGSIDSGNPITRAFDGSTSTGTWAGSSAGFELTFPSPITVANTITVVGGSSQSNYKVIVGGTEHTITFPNGSSSYTQEVTVNVSGSFTGVKATNNYGELRGIRVDGGPLLIDHEPPGVDASGSRNHWTANNITNEAGVTITSAKIYSSYNGATVSANYSVQWSDDNSNWTTAFSGVMSNNGQCGIQTGTNSGDGSYGAHKYWKLLIGSTVQTHWPRSSRLILSDGTNDYAVRTFTSDNCSDSGGIPQNGDSYTYTSSINPDSLDSLLDSPTNYEADSGNNGGNYATWNALTQKGSVTTSNGNLEANATNSGTGYVLSTIPVNSGKFYCEISFEGTMSNNTNYSYLGIVPTDGAAAHTGNDIFRAKGALSIDGNTTTFIRGTRGVGGSGGEVNNTYQSSYGFDENDTIGIAIDCDTPQVTFYKNGVSTGTYPHAMEAGKSWLVFVNDWANAADTEKYIFNAGQRPFAYTPPSGFKAICTQNLDDPTIADGSAYFDTKLWTGNSGTQTISGLGFSPDFLWYKSRSVGHHHGLQDSVRGVGKSLSTSRNDIGEQTETTGLAAFTSDGFDLNGGGFYTINNNNDSYVGWAWDGGDLATNYTYNQNQVWSSGGGTGLYSGSTWGPVFNGSPATSGSDIALSAYVTNSGTSTLTFATAISGTLKATVCQGSNSPGTGADRPTVTLSDGSVQYVAAANNSPEVINFGSVSNITTLTIAGTSAQGMNLIKLELDNKELVDKGVVPVGSLNSSAYDQSETWSNGVTSSAGAWPGGFNTACGAVTNGFNGNTGNGVCATGGANIVWNNPQSTSTLSGTLEFYNRSDTTTYSRTAIIAHAGGTTSAITLTPNSTWQNLGTYTGITTITITGTNPGGGVIDAIKVGGKLLVDAGVSVTNVPSIASTVRANPSAGFSIVTYSATGSDLTVSHGLNAKPAMIWLKTRNSASDWLVMHESIGVDHFLKLNLSQAKAGPYTNVFTSVSSTTFGTGTDSGINSSGQNKVAYCFAPVEGYSAFGSFEGNASSDGPCVYLGFRPRWLLIKTSSNADNWRLWDSERSNYNAENTLLFLDSSIAEITNTAYDIDFLSNGFKLRTSNNDFNGSGKTMIYAAFAENPFKYARAA